MNETLDFLGLPGIRTTHRQRVSAGWEIEAETTDPIFPTICCLSKSLAPDGARSQRRSVNDTPHGGEAVVIKLKVRRAKCRSCGTKGLQEALPHLHEKRHMTQRLYDHIARETLIRTNTRIAFEVGITEGTARAIVHEYIDEQLRFRLIETPRVIGFDEKLLLGSLRTVVANIEERTVVDLLPDRDHALKAFLQSIPDKHKVEVVAADMFRMFHRMQKIYFPHALHVYDRFHVVRRANDAMDKVRSAVARAASAYERKILNQSRRLFLQRSDDMPDIARLRMKQWTQSFPVLGEAYWAKERYFDMYELCHTPAEAEHYYNHWVKTLPPSVREIFLKTCRIPSGEQATATFAYFDAPYTTGYIEGVNRQLDDIQRAGRGYSYEIIRGKVLLAPKLQKRSFRERAKAPLDLGQDLARVDQVQRWNFDDLLADWEPLFKELGKLGYPGVTISGSFELEKL